MKYTNTNVVTTQQDLIDEIAGHSDIELETIREIFEWAESLILLHLKEDFDVLASNDIKVIVKPFNGLSLESEKIPEKEYLLNGKMIKASPRIKARAHLSRCFVRKTLNGLADG